MRLSTFAAPFLFLIAGACATDTNVPTGRLAPGHEPNLKSTEAGLWFQVNKLEKKLASSNLVERDPELNTYLKSVICKLSTEHCADFKIYVLKHPYFNATMAPNGTMHVWTGLLLRAESEDQLAAVLGHEMAHYLYRHSLKKYNNAKQLTDFLTFFNIATGGFGVGFVGLAASIGVAGSLYSYSRELETEADQEGLLIMHKAGYNPDAAANLWERIKEEKEAQEKAEAEGNGDEEDTSSVFWQTHPPTEERIKNLRLHADKLKTDGDPPFANQATEFDRMVRRFWHGWMQEFISTQAYVQALVVLDRLEERGFNAFEVEFFRGEVFRLRSDEEDLEKAMMHYQKASEQVPAPLKTLKHMGLVAKRQKKPEQAMNYFSQYLMQNPTASDEGLVRTYISQLRK
ncbi:M48 family metalloprotease [Sneathiella sp.]|jgi:predicted Zn-dependent protease|uniref:M48 family metalloprotease n=1 Tax=Sneathiella sp. TaxID=1964365 RepID=UPI0039E398C0